MFDCLDKPATQTGFGRLVGITQQAVSQHQGKGTIPKNGSYIICLLAYIEHLRKEASGRGGNEQEALARARTRLAEIDADNKELQFHLAVKNLIPVQEIEPILSSWAMSARSEFMHALERIIAGIETKHGITVDPELIDEHTSAAFESIAAYPTFAAQSDDEGDGEMDTAA
ncbi:hypothetical protein [Candidatus Vondammii sp. HM_W22]|uniref:hypothetical protein n=1 Tax=Candidatus Vondammii sp. HM_W22 TaxID=2687299 RepID=UPI002E7BC5A7|nr:hypothetical protein [Candidatus Vondammii sp. HM_W22]